ncbi:MAG: glycosyltransferase family 4 protein [Candidatus Margulisbacteria bacterium]|nr:glycosyltransferase family 4 protein [Candidatus Margulisiibacteriota bacterium]
MSVAGTSENRLLFIGSYPPPYGGIATHLNSLVPQLRQNNFEVDVITFGEKDEVLTLANGAVITRLNIKNQSKQLIKPQHLFRSILGMLWFVSHGLGLKAAIQATITAQVAQQIIEEKHIQVISTYHLHNAYVIPLIMKRVKIKLHCLATIFAELYSFKGRAKLRNYARTSLSACDVVMASSQYCADGVTQVGFDPNKVLVTYYSVDLEKFSPCNDGAKLRQRLGISQDKKMAFFLGRFVAEMGLDCILEIIPGVVKERDNLVFVLVGAKGPLNSVAEEVRQKYPDHVFVLNDISFAELPLYYAAADFLIAPSYDKRACMGLAIKEAMASARAIIATDSGGIPEAVVQDTGIIIPLLETLKVNMHELVRAIYYLLDNPHVCVAMGKAGRARAESLFDNRLANQRLVGLFKKICLGDNLHEKK